MVDGTSSYWEYWFGHKTSGFGVGISNPVNTIGSVGGSHYSDGQYQTLTAASTAGNGAAISAYNATPTGTGSNFYCDQDFDFAIVLRTGSSVSDIRIWIAFVDQNIRMGNNDNFVGSGKAIAFRYSSPAGDTVWTGFCQDGSSGGGNFTATAVTGATVTASSQYLLRVRSVSGTLHFSVNSGAEVSASTHVPTSNTPMGMSIEVFTTSTGATHSIEVSRASCTIG